MSSSVLAKDSDRVYPKLELLPCHEELLVNSRISLAVATARGYRSVTTNDQLESLGFSEAQRRAPALVIPVHGVHGTVPFVQIRPDNPRVGKKGRPIKYEMPSGAQMALDVHPAIYTKLGDPAAPLFITEGIRKADSAVSRGLCCVAQLGVWNYRGRNGQGGLTALADWESIAFNDRQVYIAFDSDVMLNPQVHTALVRLKTFLGFRGAHVALIYLPPGDNGAKVGLDDYLAAGHTAEDLLARATPEVRHARPIQAEAKRSGPYVSTSTGLVRIKETDFGDVDIPLTNFTAEITGDVVVDDSVEQHRHFEIEAQLHGRTTRFTMPADKFAVMNWPAEFLGAQAIVYPGQSAREHARTAIQALSGAIVERQVYGHLGWREVEERWVFLHAAGAIGADGVLPGVEVRLPDDLSRFALPDPPSACELREAIRTSLRFFDIAPDAISVPLAAAAYRAVLGETDFTVHVMGETGQLKTAVTAIAQQHYGKDMDADHLPAYWSSTGNSLEALSFAAKNVVLVVDDFAPGGGHHDVQRAHREAERFLRAVGNRAGRQRMRADTTLRPAKPPRSLVISTGEDTPRGQSLRARMLIIEVPRGAVRLGLLTELQQAAAQGTVAAAMAGYIQWIAQRYDAIQPAIREQRAALRLAATSRAPGHLRTPGIVADLAIGLRHFLRFALDRGALTAEEADTLWGRGWAALCATAIAQSEQQAAADPAQRFLELLGAAVGSGRAYIADARGEAPANPTAWGWREDSGGPRPRGDCVGWIDGEDLYLASDPAYAATQRLAADGGDSLGITLHTLRARLHDRGLLQTTETFGGKLHREVRRSLAGARRKVLHLRADILGVLPGVQQVIQVIQHGDESIETVEKPDFTLPPLLDHSLAPSRDGQVIQRVIQAKPTGETAPGATGSPGSPSAPQREAVAETPKPQGNGEAEPARSRRRPRTPKPRASDPVTVSFVREEANGE